ncbi:MAG TPA: polysaccharide lyase family 8 super-sandwich domain-containing protein [Agriterribacter sp.]|nr:polysaccharide lyase family 8 super-sandwich domain-containing protein [Agriterribacter sp.]
MSMQLFIGGKKKHLFLFLCLLSILSFGQSQPFDTIMSRINTDMHIVSSVKGLDNLVAKYKATWKNNDSIWSDIDYSDETGNHLSRTKIYAVAYTTSNSSYFNDATLYESIVQSLQFWHNLHYTHKNWWYNGISYPQYIGEILIVMRHASKKIPFYIEQGLIKDMVIRSPYKFHGANKTDIALHYLYRACLTKNKGLLDTAVEQSFAPLRLKNQPEGLQYDYSNLEHGNQLQISSYGSVFLSNEMRIASYLLNTAYALSGEKLAILSNYYRNTYLRTIRGSYIDFNTEGRGISRPNILKKTDEAVRLKKAIVVDPKHIPVWQAAIARTSGSKDPAYNIDATHTHFWRGDFDIHQRPMYSFNIRTNSVRTLRTERGGNENILGKFLPDGSTNIQRRGPEYYNIMPIWEWDKIPGVTNRDYTTDEGATTVKEWGIEGTSGFVGGASDSIYGVTAYTLNYDSVSAKKAWFFFDREIVCLGAGIQSNMPEHITTTVNQCWLNGEVTIGETSTSIKPLNDNTSVSNTNPRWVLHDSIGYYFPVGGNIHVSNMVQTGSWYRINYRNPKNEVSGKVFKLWFDHGPQPTAGTYAYIVVPGIGNAENMKDFAISNIRILENSDKLQAVEHKKLDNLQAVFYEAGVLTTPVLTLTVTKPCIVYLKNINSKKVLLYIADPTQQYKSIALKIKLPGSKQVKELTCSLPQGNYAGSTASFMIEE